MSVSLYNSYTHNTNHNEQNKYTAIYWNKKKKGINKKMRVCKILDYISHNYLSLVTHISHKSLPQFKLYSLILFFVFIHNEKKKN